MFHDHVAQKLPQFVDLPPIDINEKLGLKSINPDNATIIYESNPADAPEEFKDYKRDIDPNIDLPFSMKEKTHTFTRKNQKLAKALTKSYRKLKKFREYK